MENFQLGSSGGVCQLEALKEAGGVETVPIGESVQIMNDGPWTVDLHEVINRGDWDGMDAFFNTDTMTYDNPNRPDLGTYHVGKTSPQGLYKTFPPSLYRTLKAWGRGENEICVLCHHHGKHTGGPGTSRGTGATAGDIGGLRHAATPRSCIGGSGLPARP